MKGSATRRCLVLAVLCCIAGVSSAQNNKSPHNAAAHHELTTPPHVVEGKGGNEGGGWRLGGRFWKKFQAIAEGGGGRVPEESDGADDEAAAATAAATGLHGDKEELLKKKASEEADDASVPQKVTMAKVNRRTKDVKGDVNETKVDPNPAEWPGFWTNELPEIKEEAIIPMAIVSDIPGEVVSTFQTGNLNTPVGLEDDGNGNLFITDVASDTVSIIDLTGQILSTVITEGPTTTMLGVTTDGTFIYTTDTQSDSVRKYYLNGTFISSFSVASETTFPEGITYNPNTGNLYVVDGTSTNNVMEYTTTGDLVNTFSSIVGSSLDGIAYSEETDTYWIYDSGTDSITTYDNNFQFVSSFPGTAAAGYGSGEGLAIIDDVVYVMVTGTQTVVGFRAFADMDFDGVPDDSDNCPYDANPGQEDTDSDGIGDACFDTDTDGDGVLYQNDNCPIVPNPGQEDFDNDGLGDACDPDDDNDGVLDEEDSNPTDPFECRDVDGDTCDDCSVEGSPNPANDGPDADSDGICDAGDICPGFDDNADADNDGVPDGCDNCPTTPNPDQKDSDSDGLGDVCDNCPNIPNQNQTDTDGDGVPDVCDSKPLDPLICRESDGDTCEEPSVCSYNVTNNGDPDNFWMYRCSSQCWSTDGNTKVSNTNLNVPPFQIGFDEEYCLQFSHRYSIETGFDGGVVYSSVNGGNFSYLESDNFIQNGYSDNDISTNFGSILGGFFAFTDESPNFNIPEYIDTIASLGNLTSGDMLSVQFLMAWDRSVNRGEPNWEICDVRLAPCFCFPDVTPPVITCPSDVTIEYHEDSSSASTGVASAVDNCDDGPTITESDLITAGSSSGGHVISRTWNATDAAGNLANCVQTISIQGAMKAPKSGKGSGVNPPKGSKMTTPEGSKMSKAGTSTPKQSSSMAKGGHKTKGN